MTESYEAATSLPRPDASPAVADRLTEIGAKTIAMYQTQVQLTSAAWIAFSTHSALLLLFAVILRLVAIGTVLKVPILVWLSPLAAYVAFARGNYNAVSERLDELRLLRGVVIAETALPLRQTEPAISRRSHLLLQYVIMAAYALLAMDVVYR